MKPTINSVVSQMIDLVLIPYRKISANCAGLGTGEE